MLEWYRRGDDMNRLKQLRQEKGLKQKDIGDLFNASQNTVSNWESGNRKMDPELLDKLSEFFGVSVDYLLGRTELRDKMELTETQEKVILLMAEMSQEQQAEVLRQAQYQLWRKQQDKSDD